MSMDDIKNIIDTTIKAEIVKALNEAPEAIEKLVKAALEQPVSRHGTKPDTWNREEMAYLDWLVGDEIRRVARDVVQEVITSNRDKIESKIRERFSADDMVEAFAKQVMKVTDDDWRVTVNFASDRD